jgi:capsular exopolysaccharide synthesis family protein
LSRWYWIAISFAVTFAVGVLFLKVTKPKFEAEAYLKYNQDNKGSRISMSTDKLLNGRGDGSEYLAEVYIMKSISVVYKAFDTLHTNFYYYTHSGLKPVNIYPEKPLSADILSYDIDSYKGGEFTLKQKNGAYSLDFENSKASPSVHLELQHLKAGDTVRVPGLSFVINNLNSEHASVQFYYIDYWTVTDVAKKLVIREAERELPILKATFTADNAFFTRDFLRALINSYLAYDLEEKRLSSEQTLDFINEQVNTFESLLKKSSSRLEDFKKQNSLVDVEVSSREYLQSLSELRTRKYMLDIQARNIENVADDIKNNKDVVTNIVTNEGAPDQMLNGMVSRLNDLRFQRKQQLINLSPSSPMIKNLDEEIEGLKSRIIENVNNQKQKNLNAEQVVNNQIAQITNKIGGIPAAERDLVYLTSDVDVNKNIYSLLLNKKLETSIVKAGVLPSFSVIDYPRVAVKIFPRNVLLTGVFAIVGLAIGIVLIFLKRSLNDKFSDMDALNANADIPVLGIINHYDFSEQVSDESLSHIYASRSVFTETVNAIRTNVAYLSQNGTKNVIAVTSEVSGEGKSFVSLNLAISLTKINKRVVLIAADLRRSKLHRYFNNTNRVGLSTYLSDEKLNSADIVMHSSIPGLDYVTSGPVPINPSELIYLERFWGLVDVFRKEYDFVILDTAPVGLVSDSIPILRRADVNIFVLRWLYSGKQASALPASTAQEFDLHNVYVVVNDYKKDDLYGGLHEANVSGYSKYYAKYSSYYGDDADEEKKGLSLRKLFRKK